MKRFKEYHCNPTDERRFEGQLGQADQLQKTRSVCIILGPGQVVKGPGGNNQESNMCSTTLQAVWGLRLDAESASPNYNRGRASQSLPIDAFCIYNNR